VVVYYKPHSKHTCQYVPLLQVPAYLSLLLSETLNPFYVFQLFAVIFWCFDEYYIYGGAIFVISCASAVMSLVQVSKLFRFTKIAFCFFCAFVYSI